MLLFMHVDWQQNNKNVLLKEKVLWSIFKVRYYDEYSLSFSLIKIKLQYIMMHIFKYDQLEKNMYTYTHRI